jgi:membrane protease YdiL (CAAX protease family)
MVSGIVHIYQLDDTGPPALLISGVGRLLLLFGFYLAFKKESFFDLKKILKNNMGVSIVVGLLLFLSLQFSLPYTGIRYSGVNLTAFYIKCFSVGFSEEVLCRWIIFGLVIVAYPQRKVFGQIIIASALFALLHIGNLITGDLDIFSTLNQMLFAFLMGLFLQGLFIRFKNIILIGVLHGLINFHGMYNSIFKLETQLLEEDPLMDVIQTQIVFGIMCIVFLFILHLTMKKDDVNRLYAV